MYIIYIFYLQILKFFSLKRTGTTKTPQRPLYNLIVMYGTPSV